MSIPATTTALLHLLRDPVTGIAALSLAVVPACLAGLSPFPSAVSTPGRIELFYELAFMDLALLAALQLRALDPLRWAIARLGPLRARAFEITLLVLGTAALAVPVLSLQAVLPPYPAPTSDAIPSVGVALLQLGALGGCLLALPIPPGVRPWALLALAWFLPALLPGVPLLAATGISIQGSAPPSSGALASMLALLIAALLVARSPRTRP